MIKCPVCGEKFFTLKALKRHQSEQTMKNIHQLESDVKDYKQKASNDRD